MIEKRGRMTKEISAFIVEKGTPGFSFGTKEKKMGIRGSSTYELIFQDCRIPKDALLGAQGKGFPIAMHTLDGGRIGIASQALGIAEGALERTIEYTKERKQFGRTIAQQQNTQFQLADMATKVEAARHLVYKAAMLMKEKFNIKTCFAIHLDKNIPAAAGLAGGSSDCAATLEGINKLCCLGLSEEELCKIGVTLGADVPFCIKKERCTL